MNDLNKIYEGILGEQATQQPVYEDDRLNSLEDLKKISILKTKVKEYNDTHMDIMRSIQQLQILSEDPALIEYASKLNNSVENGLNAQDQEQLTIFQSYHFDFFKDIVDHFKLSPLDHNEEPE